MRILEIIIEILIMERGIFLPAWDRFLGMKRTCPIVPADATGDESAVQGQHREARNERHATEAKVSEWKRQRDAAHIL